MYRKVSLTIIAILMAAHIYVLVIDQEIWPVAQYSMFSEKHIRGQFRILGFYAVIPGSPEQEILLNYDSRFSINHFSIFNQITPQLRKKASENGVHTELRAILKWYNEISEAKATAVRLYSLKPAYDLNLSDIGNMHKERLIDEAVAQ